jgi:hypothetical protein
MLSVMNLWIGLERSEERRANSDKPKIQPTFSKRVKLTFLRLFRGCRLLVAHGGPLR